MTRRLVMRKKMKKPLLMRKITEMKVKLKMRKKMTMKRMKN
jgi:hypothetical protein